MHNKTPLHVIYLGQRGGGAKIALQIANELGVSNHFSVKSICIRGDNEFSSEFDQSKVVPLFENLLSLKTLKNVILYLSLPKRLLAEPGISRGDYCLVPMLSPLGSLIEWQLSRQGVNIVRLLHDFRRHPGDFWPLTFHLRRIIKKSVFLIALSRNVANQTKIINPKIEVSIYPHPVFEFATSASIKSRSPIYVLFIGRIRKYKGVHRLITAFTEFNFEDTELIIAGEGNLQCEENTNIKIINRWLKEKEISELITNAEVIVFPYIEASQSGFIPYCKVLNKKIVVTPLSGLLEQTSSYENVYVAKDFEAVSLAAALRTALEASVTIPQEEVNIPKSLESCLLESSFFTKQ